MKRGMLSIVFSDGAERVMLEEGESVDSIAPLDVIILVYGDLEPELYFSTRLTCSFDPDRNTNS